MWAVCVSGCVSGCVRVYSSMYCCHLHLPPFLAGGAELCVCSSRGAPVLSDGYGKLLQASSSSPCSACDEGHLWTSELKHCMVHSIATISVRVPLESQATTASQSSVHPWCSDMCGVVWCYMVWSGLVWCDRCGLLWCGVYQHT